MRQNENLDFSDVIMSHMSVLKINVGGNRILTIRGYERTQGTRPKTVKIEMWLRVENNNKYVRGKKKVRESIEQFLRCEYNLRQAHSKSWEYEFDVTYTTVEELEKTVDDIINTMSFEADLRNCFIEFDMRCDELDLTW